MDFGLYREKKNAVTFENEAVQKSVDVLATSSYYTFTCGPVELDVVFTAPQLIDDLDLLSTSACEYPSRSSLFKYCPL